MDALPIFLKIKGKPCLVVGGGDIAERKIDLLIRAGADVTVIAPKLGASVIELLKKQEISWIQGIFDSKLVHGYAIVIAATNDKKVNSKVSESAKQNQIPVNVVDQPELCSFTVPSIL